MRQGDGAAWSREHPPRPARDVPGVAGNRSARGRSDEAGGDGAEWGGEGGRRGERGDGGRDRRYAWALAVDAADPERWFVSAAPGPFAAHGSSPSDSAIYRWEGSGPWRVIEGPLHSHVYALAVGRGQPFAGPGGGQVPLS